VPGWREFPRGHLRLDRAALLARDADSEAYGRVLGEALFAEDAIGSAYREARAVFQSREGDGLRVRLRLDPTELHDIRWERLYHPIAGAWHPLAATADTLLSRYVMTQEWERPAPLTTRPLRVLVVIASPSDVHEYNLDSISEAEVKTWLGLFDELPDVAVTYLRSATENPPTLDRIRQALMAGYHLVHFVCHGAKTRQGTALYLENADGTVEPVGSERLLEMFRSLATRPQLCFLAACESGARGRADGFVPLGPALVAEGGIPAVVAMADRVGIVTARQFAGHFYARLLAFGAVDLAVNEARAMVRERWDWSVPVLFSRLPDNQLLGVLETSEEERHPVDSGTMPVRGVPENLSLRAKIKAIDRTLAELKQQLERGYVELGRYTRLKTDWERQKAELETRLMLARKDGASVAQVLAAHLTTSQEGRPALEIEDDLARETLAVLKEIHDNAVEFNSLLEALKQRGITITGDGNVVGDNNQVIVVKGSGVENVIQEISSLVRVSEIEFVNRENELHLLEVERLRTSQSPYTLISAPAGYGKSYLLQRLMTTGEGDENVRREWSFHYIDFSQQTGHPVAYVVQSITGQLSRYEPDTAVDLVHNYIVEELAAPLPGAGRRAVLLIFDTVERLNERARQWLYTLLNQLYERTRPGPKEIITVRVIIAGRNVESFWEGYKQAYPKLLAPRRINLSAFDERPIQELIWNQARAVHIADHLDDQTVTQIAGELWYLSGGHPRLIRNLVDDLARQSFAIGPALQYFTRCREQLVQRYLSPVADGLLESLEPRIRRAVQTLSVFRRVNANTVQVLVEAGVLPPETKAVDLLGDMQKAYWLDAPSIKEPFYRDRLMRPILALDMAHWSQESRARYQRLNSIALDLYRSWIHNLGQGLPDTPLKATQHLLSVVEWLFHALQDEGMDEDGLHFGLQEHIVVLSEGSQPGSVADLIADEIRRDAELCYLLRQRLGDDGASIVCGWLQTYLGADKC